MCKSVVWRGEGRSAGLSGPLLLQLLRCVWTDAGMCSRLTSANTLTPVLLTITCACVCVSGQRLTIEHSSYHRRNTGKRVWALQQEFMNTQTNTHEDALQLEKQLLLSTVWGWSPVWDVLFHVLKICVGQIQSSPHIMTRSYILHVFSVSLSSTHTHRDTHTYCTVRYL